MRVAIIPARGGSKRIPRKNIRPFHGKPIMAWSIEAAQNAGCFDHIVVSTDDEEIAALARTLGAEVPFLRPAELASDHAGTVPVIAHAVQRLQAAGWPVTQACCLYATAPFVTPDDLRRGWDLLMTEDVDFAFTVTRFEAPIQRALKLTGQGRVGMFQPDHFNTRSQDLEPAWHDAGQFYWGQAGAWTLQAPLFGSRSVAVEMPRFRVQDIDTPEDWTRAEWMFGAWRAQADQR
jgi:N-acylneuraminate cytidylyltransferase